MIGKSILHYRVLEKLGAGGMGVVYKAHDTKLKRDVAIKFLPREIAASDEERKRFKIEAQAAAALNHPNIATIHAIEEHDDEMFIVMEYIEGKELRHLVKSPLEGGAASAAGGVLPIDTAVNYAAQIASGLQAAHEKGVTHRDIKSANIMITDKGQAKIMDFGLAKVRGGASVTKIGTTFGTAAYMSPEQARGEEVDHRTDIWAFGVVLYEMLTGQFPFPGDYEQAVIYSILNEEPMSPLDHHPNLSEGLVAIVQRALQKEPVKRYQKASEISDEMRGLKTQSSGNEYTARSTSSEKKKAIILSAVSALLVIAVIIGYWLPGKAPSGKSSIAVLPLANSSGDSAQDYFSDGMTDALISNLGTVKALKVISRTSVMRYKSTTKSIGEIANELNVSHIVEGSVLRIDNQVRITARLIDAGKDEQIWGNTYEQELADILMLQSEVARAIASEIEVTITPQESARLTHAKLINPNAFEAYLKGRYQWNKRTKEGFRNSIRLLNEAVTIEPDYALAYAGLADNYNLAPSYLSAAPHEAYPIAKQFARQSLSLDDQIAEAHNSLAWVSYIYDWDWQQAEQAFQRAINLNPGYATAHQWYAWYLFCVGRMDEARDEIEQAQALDPLSAVIQRDIGIVLYFTRRYKDAQGELKKALDIEPRFPLIHWNLGLIHLQLKQYELALREFELEYNEIGNTHPWVESALAITHAKLGQDADSQTWLQKMIRSGEEGLAPSAKIAAALFHTGEVDAGFQWLERAYRERDVWMVNIDVDPLFDVVREDPRFRQIIERMGF